MENLADITESSISLEDADKLKHSLFLENVRIQTEKNELELKLAEVKAEKKRIMADRKRLQTEKKQLTVELNSLKEQVEFERKRLKDEQRLYEHHQKMIQHAYELLEQDRRIVQEQRHHNEQTRQMLQRMQGDHAKEIYATGVFFRGVNNEVALKKRYKELMKIFHPDNSCGDHEILLKIKAEYEELRRKYGFAI